MERPEVQSLNNIEHTHTHTVCLSTIPLDHVVHLCTPKGQWQNMANHASACVCNAVGFELHHIFGSASAKSCSTTYFKGISSGNDYSNSLLLKMAHRNSWLKMVIFHSYVSLPEGSCFVEFRYFQHFIKLRTAKGHRCCPHWTIKGFSSLGWIPYSHTQRVGWMATKEPNFT